jgi:hypothetical protein
MLPLSFSEKEKLGKLTEEIGNLNGYDYMYLSGIKVSYILYMASVSIEVNSVGTTRMLSDPSHIKGIRSKGMRTKQEGTTLVKRNDYAAYSMEDSPPFRSIRSRWRKVNIMGSVCTITYARTQILALDGLLLCCMRV